LSVAADPGNKFGIDTKHPDVRFVDVPAGQLTNGTVVSTTVTVKLHANAVAVVHVTVVVPTGKSDPLVGAHDTGPQFAVIDGAEYVTITPQPLELTPV
jgi:hypothetical protein